MPPKKKTVSAKKKKVSLDSLTSRPGITPVWSAIISDIHANVVALDAVLADIDSFECEQIYCLGDIIGYGADPSGCLEKVMSRCGYGATVLGNHEVLLRVLGSIDLPDRIANPLALAERTLSSEQQAWLNELPIVAELGALTLCHSSLNNPTQFNYLDTAEEVLAHFSNQTSPICFVGHTHIPMLLQSAPEGCSLLELPVDDPIRLDPANSYTVNVGSVGQPRDSDSRASYCLYDRHTQTLRLRRVSYDIEQAQQRFKDAGIPEDNYLRLGDFING